MPTIGETVQINDRTYLVVSVRSINPKYTSHPPGSVEVEYQDEQNGKILIRVEQAAPQEQSQ